MIIKYQKFFEAFLSKDKLLALNIIISNIKKRTGVDLYPYDEEFHVHRDDLFLVGQLFLSINNKSIRINWVDDEIRSEIHSVDLWNNFSFDSNPNYTIFIDGNSVISCINDIVKFFKDPESYISTNETYSPEKEIDEWEMKLKRARTPAGREKAEQRLTRLRANIAGVEVAEKESDKITQDDLKIDVFKAIELYSIQVARGKSNSLVITGQAGVGKSQTVIDTLKSIGMIADVHYYKSTGTITTAALYEILFKHRTKLVLFDDCDAVFKEDDSLNMLKGALDTYDTRELSKHTKGNTFDSTGMSDKEIQQEYETSGEKKLPNRFEFTGQVIFISNLPEEKFDSALISRSLHVDVHLSKKEVTDRMREIMKKMLPSVSMEVKEEALEYLIFVTDNYPVKFDLNIRTLVHSINLRVGNEEMMTIGGREELVWKLLIKKYLVKTKR
jgi:hypothetical protein